MAMDKVKVNTEEVIKDRLVAINRVTKVTKGGRTFTFAAIVVVGAAKAMSMYFWNTSDSLRISLLRRSCFNLWISCFTPSFSNKR